MVEKRKSGRNWKTARGHAPACSGSKIDRQPCAGQTLIVHAAYERNSSAVCGDFMRDNETRIVVDAMERPFASDELFSCFT
jgi:hypothetical protein